MTSHASDIVACARGYVGTRFRHQGRRKKKGADRGGVDCLGLLVGVAMECRLMKDGRLLHALDETDYGHIPDARRLYAALQQHLHSVQKDAMQAGDVLLMKMDGHAQHVGIVADYGGILGLIHAYAPARGVVEHRLDDDWLERIVAVFRFV